MNDELSQEEKELISRHREKKTEATRKTKLTLAVLRTAHEYSSWMDGEGCGDTYSTFCDDFGFNEETCGVGRSTFYGMVWVVIQSAITEVQDNGKSGE